MTKTPRFNYSIGYKSGLEASIVEQLKAFDIKDAYETAKIKYFTPQINHTYTPDFILPNGIIIETKGRFIVSDRKKHLLIKEQYPHLDIRFIFTNPQNRINKTSKTTYALWCDKYGFKYAKKTIPTQWLKEAKVTTKGLILKNATNKL